MSLPMAFLISKICLLNFWLVHYLLSSDCVFGLYKAAGFACLSPPSPALSASRVIVFVSHKINFFSLLGIVVQVYQLLAEKFISHWASSVGAEVVKVASGKKATESSCSCLKPWQLFNNWFSIDNFWWPEMVDFLK